MKIEKNVWGETAENVSYDAGNSVCCSGLRCRAKCGIKTQAYEAVPFGTEILRETLENYENVRQKLIWNNKMVQNREGFAAQLNDLAKTLCYTTHELDAGIFEDEHLKKKIRNQLKKSGIKILSSVFI